MEFRTARPMLAWLCGILLVWTGAQHASAESVQARELPELVAPSDAGLPIEVRSFDGSNLDDGDAGGRLSREVLSEADHPFDSVLNALASPANWCEILPLHLNIKGCVRCRCGSDDRVSVYVGRKFYQEPADAKRVNMHFWVSRGDADVFEIELLAPEGPVGTSNYSLSLRARAADSTRTRLGLRYSQDYSMVARLAMYGYLRTLGRGKVGFSVVRRDTLGRPILVSGLEGVIERNAMRYHLAIQAFLDTLAVPIDERLEQRTRRWFELTSAYPQLFELERDAYLEAKRREWANRSILSSTGCRALGDRCSSVP